MKHVAGALVVTTLIAMPIATTLASTRDATKAKPVVRKTSAAKISKVIGPVESMEWGDVQVSILVKNKKIIDVQATAPTERQRSAYINSIALPMLRQEVLKAQSANIYNISGASMTSQAYAQSLQSALLTMRR